MPLNDEEICLRARNIWFSYGADHILQDVSLTIKEGEFVGIAGPNGAGKTTLMKILVGLLKPQKGKRGIHMPAERMRRGEPVQALHRVCAAGARC